MLKKIILKNFRNYSELDVSFDNPVTVFTGKNGQGKTNILEGIFFAGMLRSFRTSQVRDLKKIGTGGFYIGADVNENDGWVKHLEIEYSYTKRLKIDGTIVSKSSDFIKQIKAVVFTPDDINIVLGNSGIRRRFLDILISMQMPEYLISLSNYIKALSCRNNLLKSSKIDIPSIQAYEKILADNIFSIIQYRNKFISLLNAKTNELLSEFYGDKFSFEIKCRAQFQASSSEEYFDHFQNERIKDIQRGFTGFGPHLDEIDLILNSKNLRNFGSTGQCRLISLCLNMAKINMLYENKFKNIIVLVDDVTGELDAHTKETFMKVVNKAEQVFFTFTEIPNENYFKNALNYKMENGKVV